MNFYTKYETPQTASRNIYLKLVRKLNDTMGYFQAFNRYNQRTSICTGYYKFSEIKQIPN